MSTTKNEYKIVTSINLNGSDDSLEAKLNAAAKEDWRVQQLCVEHPTYNVALMVRDRPRFNEGGGLND
jgi:hypothetical protein